MAERRPVTPSTLLLAAALASGVAVLGGAPGPARAGQQRIAVIAAADRGVPGDVQLRYAESDAGRVAAAFRELGGVASEHLLLGADAGRIQDTLAEVRARIDGIHRAGDSVLLFFFYSGHADQDFLRARGSRLTWAKLKDLVRQTGADVSVNVVDACGSGGATLAKGATLGPPFAMTVEGPAQGAGPGAGPGPGPAALAGSIWITSSRGAEASYESDEIGGSFFAHYLVSAMRGAADVNEDGHVTLSEVYQFASGHTVNETSLRLRTVQHPTFQIDLKGERDVVLTELQLSQASLVLPRTMSGTYFLSRRFGARVNVIEIEKRPGTLVRMGMGEGSYLLYRRDPDRIWIAAVELRRGRELVMDATALRPRSYDEVVGKGGVVEVASWNGYLGGMGHGPVVEGAPWSGFARAGAIRRGMALGVAAELAASRFTFAAVDTDVRNHALETRVRVEAFREQRWGTLAAGAGLALLFVDQRPTGAPAVRSLTPGVHAGASLERHLTGAWLLRADAGATLWALRPASGAGTTLRLSPEAALSVGYRFR